MYVEQMKNANILPFQDYFVLKNDYTDSLHIDTFGPGEKIVVSKFRLLKFMYWVSYTDSFSYALLFRNIMLVKFVLCKELVYVMSFYSDWIVCIRKRFLHKLGFNIQ